nr:hypothetical protein [Tanacetum cinerariifolium]
MKSGLLLLRESRSALPTSDWKSLCQKKEETFQVIIDVIKNSTCFKAFTISADVPEIFTQQFWENVDYPKLMSEDLAYQIDHRKEKRSRRENMPYPRFTKIIINHFLKQHKSHTNINNKYYHIIKDDEIIPPKKSRGRGSKGKKTTKESQETVNVSEESKPKPEPAKKKTTSKRVVKKKVTLSVDDNIIFGDPDAALELAKIVTESFSESAKKKSSGRSSKSVVIHDTPSAPKSKSATLKTKLKGALTLTPQEEEAADIMQALKEGTGSKPRVSDEDKDITEEKVILEWGDKQDSEFFYDNDDDDDDDEKDDKDGDA